MKVVFPVVPILGVVFITLKLCRVIDWSWLWVLAPFWGGFALWLVLFVIALVGIATQTGRRR